ncbi:MAG: hypothetical protein ACQESE_01725 [Nanobdellota archaeon]
MKANISSRGVWLFLAILILSVTPALAVDIEDVSFTVAGDELQAISYKKPQVVTISFSVPVENESLDSITADFSPLTNEPQYKYDYEEIVLDSNCYAVYAEDGVTVNQYNCTKEDMVMSLTSDTITIPLEVKINGTTNQTNFTKTFEVDNTRPQVTDLRTGYCEDDTCYIGKNQRSKVFIDIEDDTGTFDRKNIFFKLGSDDYAHKVKNCSGSQCFGYIFSTDCTSGSSLNLNIGSYGGIASSDDARNPLEGKLYRSVICDEFDPGNQTIFTNGTGGAVGTLITINHPNAQIYPDPKQGDSIRMHVLISEDQTGVSAKANFSSLIGSNQTVKGSCTEMTGVDAYNCSWIVRDIAPGEHEIVFEFVDGVGHEYMMKNTVYVDKVNDADLQETPKFFADVKAESGAPDGYNRIALGLAQDATPRFHFPLFATYTRQINTGFGGYDIEVLSSSIQKNCIMEYPNGSRVSALLFDDFIIRNHYPRNTPERNDNAIDILFSDNSNYLPDAATIYCNVSSYVRDKNSNTVYQNPTEFQVAIPLKFKNSALGDLAPGERYAEKIRELEDSLESHADSLEVIKEYHSYAQMLCELNEMIKTAKGVSASGTGVGKAVEEIPQTQSIGKVIKELFGVVQDTLDDISSSKTSNYLQKLMEASCYLAKCDMPDVSGEWTDSVNDFISFDSSGTEKDGVGGALQDLGSQATQNVLTLNPEESFISSVITLCLPGMIHHYAEYISMLCGKLICMKQQASMGLSISTCEMMHGRYVCTAVVDELVELFGPTRILSNLMDNIDAMLQNIVPNLLSAVLDNFYCNSQQGKEFSGDFMDWIDILVCRIPKAFGEIKNLEEGMTQSTYNFNFDTASARCSYATCDIQEDPDGCVEEAKEYEKVSDISGILDYVTDISQESEYTFNINALEGPEIPEGLLEKVYDKPVSMTDYEESSHIDFENYQGASDYAESMALNDPSLDLARSEGVPIEYTDIYADYELEYENDKKARENYEKDKEEWDEKLENSDSEDIDKYCEKNDDGICNEWEANKKENDDAVQETINWAVDVGVSVLIDNTNIDEFISLSNIFPGASEWISENLDMETWSSKVCNFGRMTSGVEEEGSGSVVQCEGGMCMPVLTMAGEGFKLDDETAEKFNSKYVYTIVFHAGNVVPANENVEDITFELYLDGENRKYFSSEDSDKITLPFHSILRIQEAFKANTTYNQICAEFDRPFPPGKSNLEDTFCRPLKVDSTGVSAFDTGSRAPADYLDPDTTRSKSTAKGTLSDYSFD